MVNDVRVKIKIDGPGVDRGEIELRQLIDFGDIFQRLLNRIAAEYGKEKNSLYELRTLRETALRVIAIKDGSFDLELGLLPRETPVFSEVDTGVLALEALFNGLEVFVISDGNDLPPGYTQPVLGLWRELGQVILQKGVDKVDFELISPNDITTKKITYNDDVQSRIASKIKRPTKSKQVLKGYLWQVNFKPDIRRVRLTLPDGGYIKCVFDENFATSIQQAMQHYVRIWGIAEIEPTTEKIIQLKVKGLTILDEQDNPKKPTSQFSTFDEVIEYVIDKNSELYRRLA